MKKIDLGQGAAILANLGVVAGIIFLAVELRQNNQILIEQSRYSMLQNQKDWTFFVNSDEEIARLMFSMGGDVAFSELDVKRRTDLISSLLRMWQWEFEQSRLGMFGESELPIEGFKKAWRDYEIAHLWDVVRSTFSPEFVQFIDNEVANQ
jgi:hypothetical protein